MESLSYVFRILFYCWHLLLPNNCNRTIRALVKTASLPACRAARSLASPSAMRARLHAGAFCGRRRPIEPQSRLRCRQPMKHTLFGVKPIIPRDPSLFQNLCE